MTDATTRAGKPIAATLANLRRHVERLGGTIDVRVHDRTTDINIDAPEGHVWSCDELHCLVCRYDHLGEREEAIRDALDRIAAGVERCNLGRHCDSGCDIYWRTQDETRGA